MPLVHCLLEMYPCSGWLRLAEPASILRLDGRVGRRLGRGLDEPTDKSETRTAQTSGRSTEVWPTGGRRFNRQAPAGWLVDSVSQNPPLMLRSLLPMFLHPGTIERFHDDCWNRRCRSWTRVSLVDGFGLAGKAPARCLDSSSWLNPALSHAVFNHSRSLVGHDLLIHVSSSCVVGNVRSTRLL
ncbi:hypothetical protein LZ30DRAFT_305830 [Colletotrichum cereale]|nr:hypothetical protein LZ30DRAFT_305830 [Colletotrichum cereale]